MYPHQQSGCEEEWLQLAICMAVVRSFLDGQIFKGAIMSDVKVAEDFVKAYSRHYQELLNSVVAACNTTNSRLPGVIDSIYTRADSAPDGMETKEPAKIASKVRQKGLPVGNPAFLELTDIVGATVVYQYPEQLKPVLASVRELLASQNIAVSDPETHKNKNGYFATHIICSGFFGGQTLNCEVQLKTMLHNAWSTKMHDLTYKPTGNLDPRLAALMGAVAETIESLEQQSQLIHDMIKASWNVEASTRRAARRQLFEVRLKYKERTWLEGVEEAVAKLHERIELMENVLEIAPLNTPAIRDVVKDVDNCCRSKEHVRKGWILAARLASFRATPDLTLFFMTQADRWLASAAELLQMAPDANAKDDISNEISHVPTAFYVIGDIDRAIDYCDRIATSSGFVSLAERRKTILKFNRAHFSVEREYHTPTLDAVGRRALRSELETVLESPDVKALDDRASTLDTEGLLKIAFGDTLTEVRTGIEECVAARTLSDPEDQVVTDAYADLNLRLGWRRYFELEIRGNR